MDTLIDRRTINGMIWAAPAIVSVVGVPATAASRPLNPCTDDTLRFSSSKKNTKSDNLVITNDSQSQVVLVGTFWTSGHQSALATLSLSNSTKVYETKDGNRSTAPIVIPAGGSVTVTITRDASEAEAHLDLDCGRAFIFKSVSD